MKGDVFLREDFEGLGDYRQVGRVLKQFVDAQKLMKIGQGVYTRTEPSILNGEPVPTKDIKEIVTEALKRLGVRTGPTAIDRAYNERRTTQVPTGRLIGVDRRVRRKLGYGGVTVSFERV